MEASRAPSTRERPCRGHSFPTAIKRLPCRPHTPYTPPPPNRKTFPPAYRPGGPWENGRGPTENPATVKCHFGFDLPGVREGRRRGDVLVLVDVLSFSTTVAAGCARGVVFLPAGSRRRAEALAAEKGGVASVARGEDSAPDRFSLSPLSYASAPRGLVVALRSPNGARLALSARGSPATVVAGLVNASAAGAAAAAGARAANTGVTVVACGERVRAGGRRRRFAAEDLLGAGAVIAAVDLLRTGEAEVALRAFEAVRGDLESVLLTTESGLDLLEAGWQEDVVYAARLDSLRTVPLLRDGEIRAR